MGRTGEEEVLKRRTAQVIELQAEVSALKQQLWDQEQQHQNGTRQLEEECAIKNRLLQDLQDKQRLAQSDEELSFLQNQQQIEEKQNTIEQLCQENRQLQQSLFAAQIKQISADKGTDQTRKSLKKSSSIAQISREKQQQKEKYSVQLSQQEAKFIKVTRQNEELQLAKKELEEELRTIQQNATVLVFQKEKTISELRGQLAEQEEQQHYLSEGQEQKESQVLEMARLLERQQEVLADHEQCAEHRIRDQTQIEGLCSQVDDLQNQLKSQQRQYIDSLSHSDQIEQEGIEKTNQLTDHYQAIVKRLEEQMLQLQGALQKGEAMLCKAKEERARDAQQNKSAEQSLKDALKNQEKRANFVLRETQAKLKSAQSQLSECQRLAQSFREEKQGLEQDNKAMTRQQEALKRQVDQLQQENQQQEMRIAEQAKERESMVQQSECLSQQMLDNTPRVSAFAGPMSSCSEEGEVEELREEVQTLTEYIETLQVRVKDLTALLEHTQYGRTSEAERLHLQVQKLQKQNGNMTVQYFKELTQLKSLNEDLHQQVVRLTEQSTAANMRWAGEMTYLMGSLSSVKKENRQLAERFQEAQKTLLQKGQMSVLDRLLR